ncbi:S8 family peptidase [Streptococcus pneumoniae]|nr:S8 family peptidase [Streptococcus pneumoniae]MDG8867695.1 S8 family peptidase [Streptococcus pneumoniae]UKP69350.1 S8 family peptidase [Streptococcus pneumoniae]HET0262699.1 S8 family peptidase [Streptococcus pneumoniae]HET3630499.1 S8 family peptidase [Streptococcus pneumoniae]HET5292484.1 S8 family peptidase [Streptococcus pneumoniae]
MGPITIPKKTIITLEHLKYLHFSLEETKTYWEKNNIIDGILISIYYNRIVAKSNRINGYFNVGGGNPFPNDTIVGAKFNDEKTKHIVTHYISRDALNKTITVLSKIIEVFEEHFDRAITCEMFSDSSTFASINFSEYGISKSKFQQYLRDSCFIENFGVEHTTVSDIQNSIVTFYDVHTDIFRLLNKLNIDISEANIMNQTTVLLDEKNIELLLSKAPYLVSMIVEDFSKLSVDDFSLDNNDLKINLPSPMNEPVVGVIDTLFDKRVYFNEWVEYHDLISPDISKGSQDYKHGTAVSSVIVDGASLNPKLDDGCGRFRVRHFGISLQSGFNSFTIIKQIREIVSQNPDIKVWNLSLGSNDEIRENFISVEGSLLDEIQFDNDVIFIIAGTNGIAPDGQRKKIGAPADSLNSIIVNSVDFSNQVVSYSREGVVLSFFIKPDVSYYGGGNGDFINVCEPLGLARVAGTSFAAPFIARKMAYLIHIMGLSREEAKALLIDSAIPWNDKKTFADISLLGYGVVPIKIEDILSTPDDEIKFIVSDVSRAYETYNYDFPVPISKEHYPYVAKATMCYFPKCSRNQGVDYTNTEMQLSLGVLDKKGIKTINNDNQYSENAPGYVREKSARNIFRKWDNVKHLGEKFSSRKKAKPILNPSNPQWGMSVKTIERLRNDDGYGIRFGVVVTLKELNGVNRIEDFIQQAELRGWLVNRLQVEAQVGLFNSLNEEIEFE